MRREIAYEIESETQIDAAIQWARPMIRAGLRGGKVALRCGRPRRTLDQNSKLWPMVRDVSRQVVWHGNRLNEEEWKDLFTGVLKGQKAVPNIDGTGFVVVGGGSSTLSVREFCDLIELIFAFGSEREVHWSEESEKTLAYAREKYPEAAA